MLKHRLRIRKTDGLTATTFDEMYRLYADSHDVGRREFEEKTRRKFDEICLVRKRRGGELVAFIGARTESIELDGNRYRTLYMGQAMTDPAARGSGVSLLGPLAFASRAALTSVRRPVIGWQDALTVRTFLLVARFTDVYYPHPTLPMPREMLALRDHLGSRHSGAFNPVSGTVSKGHRLVVEEDIRPEKLQDEHIGFFARANPGYVHGDGLLQLFPLSPAVCLGAARRLFARP